MFMKKKIMLIVPMLHQGGFERICVMTARLLEPYYDVVLVVFSLEDIAFDVTGITVIDLKLGVRKGKIFKIINVFKRGYALRQLQKKLKTDISYSFGMTANIANAFSRNNLLKLTGCHSFEEIKKGGYMKLIGKRCDSIFCCSKKMADMVEKTYGFSNVFPLWNPCDIEGILAQSEKSEKEEDFFDTSDKILVSMGREDDVKGFWHLLKCFRRIWEERQDVRLMIVGDGDFIEYKELAKKLEIENKVWFTGLKNNPFPYLNKCDLYLLTSLSEGLPNALVEALALSLPIVSVNCKSGPAEILHEDWRAAEGKKQIFFADYGVLTPELSWEKKLEVEWKDQRIVLENSEENFAEAVLQMLSDDKLYERYVKTGSGRAKDFSKEAYIKELVNYIEKKG